MTSIRRKWERNDVCIAAAFGTFAAAASTIASTNNQIESLNNSSNLLLSPVLILFQDRHFAEVKALQTRLEEQQDKNKTLTQVNAVQREQLEVAQNSDLGVAIGPVTISCIGQADDVALVSNYIFLRGC